MTLPGDMGITDVEPLVVSAPDQSSSAGVDAAVQPEAFMLDQVRVTDDPTTIPFVEAESVRDG